MSLDDFYAYMPMHCYVYVPSREMWPASSVNARIAPVPGPNNKSVPASTWLDQHKAVEQMSWCPGLPLLVRDRLVAEGGWIERGGVSCFNLYRAPTLEPGDAGNAGPWLDHVRRVFGDNADHIVKWLAQRAQRPGEKSNHALVLHRLSVVSLPMPGLPPSTSAWLIFSPGRCALCVRHFTIWSALSPNTRRT